MQCGLDCQSNWDYFLEPCKPVCVAVIIALVLPLLDKQSNSISDKECQPGTGASHVCDSDNRQRK